MPRAAANESTSIKLSNTERALFAHLTRRRARRLLRVALSLAVCRTDGVEKHFCAERRDFVWRPSETFTRVLTAAHFVGERFAH